MPIWPRPHIWNNLNEIRRRGGEMSRTVVFSDNSFRNKSNMGLEIWTMWWSIYHSKVDFCSVAPPPPCNDPLPMLISTMLSKYLSHTPLHRPDKGMDINKRLMKIKSSATCFACPVPFRGEFKQCLLLLIAPFLFAPSGGGWSKWYEKRFKTFQCSYLNRVLLSMQPSTSTN